MHLLYAAKLTTARQSDVMFVLCCSYRMAKVFPVEFNFVPKTWILPSEYTVLQTYSLESKRRRKKGKTYIVKPANGAMGNGLVLSLLILYCIIMVVTKTNGGSEMEHSFDSFFQKNWKRFFIFSSLLHTCIINSTNSPL